MTSATVDNSQATPLGAGKTNPAQGSQVQVSVVQVPMAFLRLDTGEVIGVPAHDVTDLNNEFDKWNRLMYEQLLANNVLALTDERLLAIAQAKASNPASVSTAIEADAHQAQGLAIEWQKAAADAVRGEMKALDKLGSNGKKLIELIPLVDKAGDKRYMLEKEKGNGEWKMSGMDLKKPWGFKTAAGFKGHFKQEERYAGLGTLRVANSDKLKSTWPKFKDAKSTKWAEVYKAGDDGKRKIDRTKLRGYLGEQVQGLAKLKSSDFVKLEASFTGTLGPEALEKWNANANATKEGKVVWGDTQLGDIDFSAEAAAMRYYSGGSLSAEIAPLKGNIKFKAEGGAEVAFAEGKVGTTLYVPSKEGLMLYYLDLAQIKSLVDGSPMQGDKLDLGAVRLACSAELKGVVGVSLAGEVSIGVEMKDVETQDVDGKTKTGKMPVIKGSRKKTKRVRAADVTGKADDWKNTAGLAAEVNFFAGAKGGVEIKGAIEWRNPHNEKKAFEMFASIAPELQGMAGLAGEAKLNVDYVDGVFRITAHAGLCFGIGAEGSITLAVNAKQLGSFAFWMYYNLLNAEFRSLTFIQARAFEALQNIFYLMICQGRKIGTYFGENIDDLRNLIIELDDSFTKAQACLDLARKVISEPNHVRFSTPESKGMLIYQLTRFSAANWVDEGLGLFDLYLPTQRKAVLSVLRQTQLKADMQNVIQHIGPKGQKVDFEIELAKLKRFFAAEGPRGLDVPGSRTQFQNEFQQMMRQRGYGSNFIAAAPSLEIDTMALNGDFGQWYDAVYTSLKDEATRGYVAVANSEITYALQRDLTKDHPLFASAEGGLYNNTA